MIERKKTLCLSCALCCDGSLFDYLQFIDVEGNNTKLSQPCKFLKKFYCQVYQTSKKPQCCSLFKCQLLTDYNSNKIDLKGAIKIITATRIQIVNLKETIRQIIDDNGKSKSITQLYNAFLEYQKDNPSSNKLKELKKTITLDYGILITQFKKKFISKYKAST